MEGFITWYSEYNSWGIFIVDENFDYIIKPEYFCYKWEALEEKKKLSKQFGKIKWEIGKKERD
ncbi:gp415 [Bacillus phage G]|uniref:Gp415 n=1 Tax=Bacillus phage G TaxID=2884420 RepID=G3MAF6_9CAUD|nr:gp415 [Bacillus phage G]AEO93673.1 gp415 [Bacillus phage G]